jgi:hypothetical protein
MAAVASTASNLPKSEDTKDFPYPNALQFGLNVLKNPLLSSSKRTTVITVTGNAAWKDRVLFVKRLLSTMNEKNIREEKDTRFCNELTVATSLSGVIEMLAGGRAVMLSLSGQAANEVVRALNVILSGVGPKCLPLTGVFVLSVATSTDSVAQSTVCTTNWDTVYPVLGKSVNHDLCVLMRDRSVAWFHIITLKDADSVETLPLDSVKHADNSQIQNLKLVLL